MSDRPDDAAKIEMTEAMIEAGLDAYYAYDDTIGMPRVLVTSVFKAMAALSPSLRLSAPQCARPSGAVSPREYGVNNG